MSPEELESIPTSALFSEMEKRMEVFRRVIKPLPDEVQLIIRCVCENFHVTESQMMSNERPDCIAFPRFAAGAILRAIQFSPQEVAAFFNKDYAWARHAVERTEELRVSDNVFRYRLTDTLKALQAEDKYMDIMPTPHRAAG